MKRIYKHKENKIFCGILGGLGEYLEVDPTIIRLLWILLTISTGILPGLVFYFLACLIVPDKNGKE